MSITEIPDEAESRSTMTELAVTLADLLAIADHLRLPLPRYVSVSRSRSISLQLPPEMASIDAVRLWASVYCAAMRSDTHEGENGPKLWVTTAFDLDGVNIDVYACIPVPQAEPIPSTEQDSEPDTVLPF